MAVYKLERFEVRPEARDEAERAMHAFAMYVREHLDDSMWTTYRDTSAPNRYIAMTRTNDVAADQRHADADGTKAFVATLSALVIGDVESAEYELVTSSDLAPRHRDRGGARGRRRLGR
ncbi:MAG TPA: hypothetical protein VMZ53_16440 [Kofleriaceae bacterium]|nr:hypothetical protein [Kofleriaceae bacterium]